MNKLEFVSEIAKTAGLTQTDAKAAVKAFEKVITDTLVKGENIALVGFGTFEVRDRAARTGFNPLTKEKIEISACKVPAFKPGAALKNAVNSK